MRNVEVKLRLTDQTLEQLAARARALGARPGGLLEQTDTYFVVPRGRLKLREIHTSGQPAAAWLIGYGRPDTGGARVSSYEMAPIPDPAALLATLSSTLRIRIRVEKRREVLLLRHTRIHLDEVRGLGNFVEFETVVGPADERRGAADGVADEVEGAAELAEIAAALGLDPTAGIAGSYADLLESEGTR